MGAENVGHRFDRLPETQADQTVRGRPSRTEVAEWWTERFGIDQSVFDGYSFWEKGAGMIWLFHGAIESPVTVEALGLRFLRVRQTHWKPTTNAVQRFGESATRNVIRLTRKEARKFVRGETQPLDWDGDWGYLIANRDLGGEAIPIGVGLYLDGELKSQIPKARQRDLPA